MTAPYFGTALLTAHTDLDALWARAFAGDELTFTVQNVSGTTTLAAANLLVRGDATSAAFTVTLPSAASVIGQVVVLVKIDSGGNGITVSAAGGDTIAGAATKSLGTQWSALTLIARTAGWDISSSFTSTGAGGAPVFAVQAVTASTALGSSGLFVTITASSAAITVTLPDYASVTAGSQIICARLDATGHVVALIADTLNAPESVSPTPDEAYLVGQYSQMLCTATASGWECAPLNAPTTMLPITTNADVTLPPGSYAVACDVSAENVTLTLCSGGSQVTASPLVAVWVQNPGGSVTLLVDDSGTINGQASMQTYDQFSGWLLTGIPETDNYVILSTIGPSCADWTPVDDSGASLTFAFTVARTAKSLTGKAQTAIVTVSCYVSYPVTGSSDAAQITGPGLPNVNGDLFDIVTLLLVNDAPGGYMTMASGTGVAKFFKTDGTTQYLNSDLSTKNVSFTTTYLGDLI